MNTNDTDSETEYFTELVNILSMHKKAPRTIVRQAAFLYAYSIIGIIEHAASAANVSRRTVLRWRSNDPKFAAAYADAKEMAVDGLVDRAIHLAIVGNKRLVFRNGQALTDPLTGDFYVEIKPSDLLMIFLLKYLLPEQYGDKARGAATNPHEIRITLDSDYGSPIDANAQSACEGPDSQRFVKGKVDAANAEAGKPDMLPNSSSPGVTTVGLP